MECDALEACDGQPRALSQAADLPVAALVDRDAEEGRGGLFGALGVTFGAAAVRSLGRRFKVHTQQLDAGGAGLPAIDLERFGERQLRAGRIVADPEQIDLFDLLLRVHQAVGQLAVVRQEQQPLGVEVEPPNGVDALRQVRDEIGHGPAALFVRERGHIAARLV